MCYLIVFVSNVVTVFLISSQQNTVGYLHIPLLVFIYSNRCYINNLLQTKQLLKDFHTLVKPEFIVNDHLWSFRELYVLDVGELEIENCNTAFA